MSSTPQRRPLKLFAPIVTTSIDARRTPHRAAAASRTDAQRREGRAFTMIELIVVIVILGILAGIAIVGFGSLTAKAQDASAVEMLNSVHREAVALAAFEERGVTYADYEAAAADLPGGIAYAPGILADGTLVDVTYPGNEVADPAATLVIDAAIDGSTVGLAAMSDSGRTAFLNATTTSLVADTWVNDCAPDALTALAADPDTCYVAPVQALAAPTSPAATCDAPTLAGVTISWTAVTGATGYEVSWGTTASGPYPNSSGIVTGLSYSTPDLPLGTHYFVVTAAQDGLRSGPSVEVTRTVAIALFDPECV